MSDHRSHEADSPGLQRDHLACSARMSHHCPSSPICLLCSEPMQVARTVPAVAQLPEVLVFHCEGCGEVETREHDRAA